MPDTTALTREELLAEFAACKGYDTEVGHSFANSALLRYINDPEITQAYEGIEKWYA